MKKTRIVAASLAASCLAAAALAFGAAAEKGGAVMHRYLIERSFPAGAIDGISVETKRKVNETNARFGVRWQFSYVTPDKTKTYCVYLGPNEDAIRRASEANGLPLDSITEVPSTLDAE